MKFHLHGVFFLYEVFGGANVLMQTLTSLKFSLVRSESNYYDPLLSHSFAALSYEELTGFGRSVNSDISDFSSKEGEIRFPLT